MLILLRLNEKGSYTVTDLMDSTGINKDSFDNNLKQLIKLKILNSSEGEGYSLDANITTNTTFDFARKVVACQPKQTTQVIFMLFLVQITIHFVFRYLEKNKMRL